MKMILGIAALAFILAAPLGTAKADPWKDKSGNNRGWREHSRSWDRDRDEHNSRRGDRDRDGRHSRDWDRGRHNRGNWDRDRGGYGSSFPHGNGGSFPYGYGR